MVAFGIVCAPAGLWLWNGLGPHFGIKVPNGKVDRTAALGALAVLFITVIAELLISAR